MASVRPEGGGRQVIFTVGHSTRGVEELIAILHDAGVEGLVDARTVPRSRRHPQFGRESLQAALPAHGIAYRHEPRLGGFRRPRPNSPNGAWTQQAFQGYADHMASDEFAAAVTELETGATDRTTAIMCAEAQWWRCHRRLVADALAVRGWQVVHLGLGGAEAPVHELTPFAVVGPGGELSYPPSQTSLPV